jgi:hypothetical protein
MYFPLPSLSIVDRERHVVELCRGKKVVHLGAAQASDNIDIGMYGQRIDPATFLHSRISAVASSCLGIDYNSKSIEFLRSNYKIENIVLANIENASSLSSLKIAPDIIVMGELIEHLLNPGLALSNIKEQLMSHETQLVITTPNALDASNFLYGLLRKEAQDPDHVATYSPRLLRRLCEKSGLDVVDLKYYQVNISSSGRNMFRIRRPIPRRFLLFLFYNSLLRINSAYSSGLIVTARKVKNEVRGSN